MNDRDKSLQQFFAGYFNQDWDTSGALGWSDVVDEYLTQNEPKDALRVVADLRSWLSDAEKHERLPTVFGCEYDPAPDGMDQRQWVQALADYLGAKASARGS